MRIHAIILLRREKAEGYELVPIIWILPWRMTMIRIRVVHVHQPHCDPAS